MRKTNPDPKVTPGAYRVPAAAQYLGVSEPSIWRLLENGSLPRIKIFNSTLIRKSDLDALLERSIEPLYFEINEGAAAR